MRLWPPRTRLAGLIALAALAALLLAGVALGSWGNSVSGGPMPLVSATLDAPTGVGAANGTCVKHGSASLAVSWTASLSPAVGGYEIFRSATAGGPYTSVGTVSGAATTSYDDPGLPFNTTYYYVVEASRANWRSPQSAEASALTYNSVCR